MTEDTDNSIKTKSLEILLNKNKSENELLKNQNEYLKKFRNHIIGYILLFSSAIVFLLCIFLIENIQIIFLGAATIALVSLAIYLIFIYSPKTYPLKTLISALNITTNNLAQMLIHFQFEKNTIFLPVTDTVYQFIPFISASGNKDLPPSNELNHNTFEIENKGIIFHPIGFSIIELVEKDLNINLHKINQNKIENLLYEILIDQLNLLRAIDFSKFDKGRLKVILSENKLSNIYQKSKDDIQFISQIGCPICSFIAILLAWSTGRSILLKSVDFNQIENITTILYEFGDFYH